MGDPQVTNDLDDLGYPQDWGNLQSQHVSKVLANLKGLATIFTNDGEWNVNEILDIVTFWNFKFDGEWNLNELLVMKGTV